MLLSVLKEERDDVEMVRTFMVDIILAYVVYFLWFQLFGVRLKYWCILRPIKSVHITCMCVCLYNFS